uniref:citrate transporter n=1 Tax=Enterocloster clostridioformis TaxID=1531 RepID=UPI0026ECE7FD|nr:citrate transporter [Enterocloster clostridioformis]
MIESAVVLTPLHYAYLIGVIVILAVMVIKKDTPAVCIAFLFILGLIGLKSVTGGIITVFSAVLYAGRKFMEVLATIALVTSLSKCLKDLGSDYLMMVPMAGIMKNPSLTWWILGLTMFLFSLFLWPSPSVALVGAIMLPFAVKAGLNPLAAAMAMNLFGHGFALSYDVVIQGAPAISAGAAGLDTSSILQQAWPLFWIMGIVTVLSAYVLNRSQLDARGPRLSIQAEPSRPQVRKAALFLAVFTPLAFAGDVILLLLCGLKGGDATSMVSGTALLLTCLGALLGFGKQSLEKVTGYVTEGFLFAIRIFAPVIIIGAFFFLGGDGITSIMGERFTHGIMNDWALWLAQNAPLNKYMAAFIQMVVGGLTGLDGSGFSGLPLTGALARTFGTATGSSVPVMAALGQITAIFVGGGTIVPWGLIPVAAICNVSPLELARKNLIPVCIGFACTFALACFML